MNVRSSMSRRGLALGLTLALVVPVPVQLAGLVGTATTLAADPQVSPVAPAANLRPDPDGSTTAQLREPTRAELADADLGTGTGPCAGVFEDTVTGELPPGLRCSHGPDVVVAAAMSAGPILIDGDDYVPPPVPCFTSGPFVKVFYVYENGHPNRLASLKPRILRTVAAVDDIVSRSAESVGRAVRHVRWLMTANCDLSITAVGVSAAHFETYSPFGILVDLINGHTLASNQKALVFTDDPGTSCNGIAGIASVPTSDSPSVANPANSGQYIARVFGWCTSDPSLATSALADIAAHEVMHTLGAVQDSSPNSSHYGHCTDGDDVMCYIDHAGGFLASVCPEEFPRAFDCNKNDYFNPTPPAGSYLAGHWNTANNVYLSRVAATSASTTAPVVKITAPSAGTTAAGDFTLAATATDPGGAAISRVDFYVNGTLLASDTSFPYGAKLATTQGVDGTYRFPNGRLTIDAVAYDAAGRWNLAPEVALALGNARVSLTTPGDLAVVTGPVPWSAAPVVAPGRTVAKVELLADGSVVATDTTSPYGGTWSPDLTASQTDLAVRVTDSGGSIGRSATRQVFPTLATLTLYARPASAGSPVLLLAATDVTGFVPIEKVDFYREPSGGGARTLIGSDAVAPYTATWASPVAGDYTLVARAVPVGGVAVGAADATTSLHVDPAHAGFGLTLNAPVSGSTVLGTSVALVATPTAPAGWIVNQVDFTVDGWYVDGVGLAPWTGIWDSTSATGGPHLVGASAQFMNETTFELVDLSTVGAVVIRKGPTVSVSAPAPGASLSGAVTVRASVVSALDDPVTSVDFYAGGRYLDSDGDAPFESVWYTDGLGNGPVALRAVANGWATRAKSAPVVVNIAYGSVALTAPSAGAVIAGRTTLTATATSKGDVVVERVTFLVDGLSVGTDDEAPFSVAWNSATVALGGHRVAVSAWFGDGSSRTSTDRSISVVLPGGPARPTARMTALAPWLATKSIALGWSATPGPAPIASYDVRYRRAPWNGVFGAYAVWLSATAAKGGVFAAGGGWTYCFSTRARDTASGLSDWSSETCTAIPLDDRSLTTHGTWAKSTSASYYNGTYRRASTYGKSLTRTGIHARRIAILATVCPTCGTVRIYWGSTRIKTVSLYARTTSYRKLIPVALFSTGRTGTLTIRIVSRYRKVLIDGLAIRGVY